MMMGKSNCEFKGAGGEYFVTVFIHLVIISSITFCLYLPWALVKLLRLKASHTVMNGKQVSFTGTGGQLFIIMLVQGLVTCITFGLYGPWAICKFLKWSNQNTLVDGKSSQFTGTGGSLFLLYLIHLMILPMLTLGLYYLVGLFRLYAWKEENTKYGGEQTSFGAGVGEFVKIAIIGWLLNTVTFYVFSPWFVCMLYKWQIQGLAVGDGEEIEHFPKVKVSILIPIVLVAIGVTIFIVSILVVTTVFKQLALYQMKGMEAQMQAQFDAMRFDKESESKTGKPSSGIHSSRSGLKPGEQSARKEGDRREIPVTTPPSAQKGPVATGIDYELEIMKLNDLINKDSENADAIYNRAWLHASREDVGLALKDYSRVIGINSKYGDAYYNRGLIYAAMKKYDQAINDFDQALKCAPPSADVYCNRGNAYYNSGNDNLAIADYNKGLKIDPKDGDLYYNRGVVYISQDEKPKAMADFRKSAQSGHEKAREYLRSQGEAVAGSASSSNSSLWREDLSDVQIPETMASGMIHGDEFTAESAKLQKGILTIRDGQEFFPDHAVTIFLFLEGDETPEGKVYNITKSTGFGSPHIHMKWRQKEDEAPKTEIFMQDYSMRLGFGTMEGDQLSGAIYLCLPDKMKSWVVGSFTAIVK